MNTTNEHMNRVTELYNRAPTAAEVENLVAMLAGLKRTDAISLARAFGIGKTLKSKTHAISEIKRKIVDRKEFAISAIAPATAAVVKLTNRPALKWGEE